MKILETKRLILRKFTIKDADFMLMLLNDPSFLNNIGDRGVRTIDDAEKYLSKGAITSYEQHGFGLYMVELTESNTPIGICGLVKRETLKDVDIGFAFLPKYWKKGYAYESASAVMTFAKDVIGLKRIVAITSPNNTNSIRLLEKIGLRFEQMIKLSGDSSELKLFGIKL